MFQVVLSVIVILDGPAKAGMLVGVSPCRRVCEDAGRDGMGNDEPRGKEQQPCKADRHRRKHPLTVQP